MTTDFRKINDAHFIPMPDRGFTKATAQKFGVMSYQEGSPEAHVYPYYDRDGNHVANKVRMREGKDFRWEGAAKSATLFGQNIFPAGGRKLTIVEGECDALAVYQINETAKAGSNYPVVSVHSAATARKNIADNFDYVDSFDEIVLVFDRDEGIPDPKNPKVKRYPGQEAARAVAQLFELGKVRICTLEDYKDANDYLQNRAGPKFLKEWWNAPKFTPQGIKTGAELWDDISNPPSYETVPWPFKGLDHMTYGIRLSEFIVVTAPEKIGKTTVLKAVEHNLLHESEHGIGILHLEETNTDTALGLMSIEARKPLHLPDVRENITKEQLRYFYDKTINNDRLVLWDHFGSNTVDEVLSVIRHMHAMGCKYIILDHLSIVVSDQSGDERKQLDELATRIKMICMELNIAVIAVAHQNAEGGVRGTKAIEQLANLVVRLERNPMDTDPWRRSVTTVLVSANRFCGRTGPACYLRYVEEEGVLEELDEADAKLFAGGGSVDAFEEFENA